MPKIKKFVKIYKKTIPKNLKNIKSILKNAEINNPIIVNSYEKILFNSTEKLTEKWMSGRKYARTSFVKEAFSEFYPKEYTELSLYIDTMINILDDLLDEEMDKNEKTCYVVEFLRAFSLYHQKCPQKKIQIAMSHYFNKLITLAIAEGHYKNFIKKEMNMNKIIKYSIESYTIRSLDIDIFNQIALIDYKEPNQKTEKIKQIGRIFRAVNIIKKDIEDIEYDTKNNMESIISIIIKKECDFAKYISALLNYYLAQAEKIKFNKQAEKNLVVPINNFYDITKKNKIEILKKLKSL